MPPLSTSRASRGVAPRQSAKTPSRCTTLTMQSSVLRYSARAASDCMRVLTTSSGIVAYTVTMPATAPIPNVTAPGSGCVGLAEPTTRLRSVEYVPKRTALFAPCRSMTGTRPR